MFSDRLIELRKKNKMTQQKLADSLNMSLSSIGNWESINIVPPADKLIKLADFFKVSLDYLLDRESTDDLNMLNSNSNIIINQNKSHNPIATVTVKNGEIKTRELSEMELELLKICEKFDAKQKNAVLNKAYEIENQIKKGE